ncbi:MAG TPA: ATP-binding protein [Flavisolibacter sp.]|nr:ATP-binding protein [Flavisolibacter sp.]
MYDLAKVTLENEMDLVLAHKRSMKLAEIAGLSLSAQTTFATAVSEVARNTIDNGKNGCLTLGISDDKKRSIVACIQDDNLKDACNKEGLDYARRLVDKLNIFSEEDENSIELYYFVPNGEKINVHQLDQWRSNFRNEPPISPYDEIKRKSEQLKELTEEIKRSEDHYRMLTDTLPLMMFSLDAEGDITYANKWTLDYLGYTFDELNTIDRPSLVHAEDRPLNETFQTLIQKGEPVRGEWRIRNRSGSYFWHIVSISPIINDGKATGWFGFLVDIQTQKLFEQTLRDNQQLKEVQQQLQHHIKELNRSNEELQQFAFVASHDLQEPLRKVIFYSDYFQSQYGEQLEGKSAVYLKGIKDASMRMRVLITDLLSFSQVNKQKLELNEVDLAVIMKEALSDYELIIKEKNAGIAIDPLPVIEGDKTMLRRLFENLLSNALKYCREGVSPVISVNAVEKNGMVEIEVRDNGIGFEEQFLPKLFTLFQRLHSKEKFEGTGLGLAICRKIAEMHNGFITAKSSVNEGSSFFVSLPLKQK